MINDDIGIIMLASGYLGGKPAPFLIYSNVVLGWILNLLYALPVGLNWEIILFIALNFLCVWALIYLVLSRPIKNLPKLTGVLAVLFCDSYFLINLTFTTIAAFTGISGFALILMTAQKKSPVHKRLLAAGITLIWAGGLIRLEAVLLVFLILLPALVFCFRSFDLKRLIIALSVGGCLAGGFYAFDRAYVRSVPDWNAFDIYNQTRSMLQDTPRWNKMEAKTGDIGWSANDLKLFLAWFFPDEKTYSLANLQYLVEHVPGRQGSLRAPVVSFLRSLTHLEALPYVLMIAFIWLAILFYPALRRAAIPFAFVLASLVGINIYLAWAMSDPDRVLLPSMAAGVIFGLCFLDWRSNGSMELLPSSRRDVLRPIVLVATLASVMILVLVESIQTTGFNLTKQTTYRQILSDLDDLQRSGAIAPNALIISPSYGIPLEWTDPLTLSFPRIQYLDLGWLTFSPPYYEVLRQHDIASLPAGLYQKENVYLLSKPVVVKGLLQYIQEHEGVNASVETLYSLPNSRREFGYNNLQLYKVVGLK